MTYQEIYNLGKQMLVDAGIEEASLDARLLLEFVCGTDRNTLLVHGDRTVTAEQEAKYRELLARREKRVPLQHLTGTQAFMGLDFTVNEHVLIPRQDTEVLVEEALKELHDGMHVLDMCTGSGCILISLLHYSNDCTGVGADISGEALAVARENAQRLLGCAALECPGEEEVRQKVACEDAEAQREPAGGSAEAQREANNKRATAGESAAVDEFAEIPRYEFMQSDLFENVDGLFDMIVSNPPYINTDVIETLMPEVRDYEPKQALDGTADGLEFYRRIIRDSKKNLKKGGMLFFEIGHDQGEAVAQMMEQAGYLEVRVIKDYAGMDRVVSGVLSFGSL